MSKNSRKARDIVAADYRSETTLKIPWPEWSDAELNAEKWDGPKNGTDGHFSDPDPRAMPSSLKPYDWKRASAIKNLSGNTVIFTSGNSYPDFIKNNKHILHSEFVRWFISTMISLQNVGSDGLRVEESPNFIWLEKFHPWQGWMYVYSLNKAGKNAQQHRPIVNPNGKYVVRLFFMGFWRRFVVDDIIPIDEDGTPLLPRTENYFELWPMLVAKAMMKLAALTWTNQREIKDFYPVSCFTGWICLPLVTRSFSLNEKWDLLIKYLDDSQRRIEARENEREMEMSPNKSITVKQVREGNIAENKKTTHPSGFNHNSLPSVVLFANLTDTSDLIEETIPELTPCCSHPVYIARSRGAFASGNEIPPSQVRWKLFRWIDWATRHGIAASENFPVPGGRSLKLVSPLMQYKNEGKEENVEKAEETSPVKTKKLTASSATDSSVGPSSRNQTATLSLPDIGVWVDFNKMAAYIEEIFMFYKPSDFEYYARVSDLLTTTADNSQVSAGGAKGKSQPAGGKDGKKTTGTSSVTVVPSFVSSLKWQHEIFNRRNDPLYMLIDSTETKFVMIDFSRMPRLGHSPLDVQNSRSKDTFNTSYLIVERHNFFERFNDEDPVALIKTFSSGATVFEAGPGRCLYRIFFRTENSYFLRILSDTIFHVGDRFRIQDLMSFEAERVDAIVKNISNKVSTAFQQFGKPEYANQLRALHQSYMPQETEISMSKVNKKLLKTIHETFLEELTKLVRETFVSTAESTAICHALKIFFIDPTIGAQTKNNDLSNFRYLESSGTEEEKAAIRIQSFFRMALVKIYKRAHLPSDNKHAEVVLNLRKVVELFNYTKRESIAHQLIRKIIKTTYKFYSWYEDLNLVLKIDEWKGITRNVQPSQWVPLVRIVVNASTPGEKVHAAIDLVTGLPRYVLRVVNNETHREVTRIVSNVATVHYPYVERGYTVIGYGWSDDYKFKELYWHFRLTTIKGQPSLRQMTSPKSFLPILKPPSLQVQEMFSNYLPNVCNIIGKWIIEITADSLLSFRLFTSYKMVNINVKILHKDENVLHEASGGSVLILPAVYLPFAKKRDIVEALNGTDEIEDLTKTRSRSKLLVDQGTTEYYVRVYVTNDSWPLTPTEWTVVKDVMAKGTIYDPQRYSRTSTSSVSKRGTRVRASKFGDGDPAADGTSPTILQDPFLKLQVLTDVGTKVQVEKDRRREIEIANIKKEWEDGEAGRMQRGRILRDAFIEEKCIVSGNNSKTEIPESEREELIETFEESSISLAAPEIRTLKPPQNSSCIFPSWAMATCFFRNEEEEEDEQWVKTEGDEEVLRNQRAINLFDFDQMQESYVEEETKFLEDQRKRYSDILDSYMKKVANWKNLANAADELRNSYIAEIKATVSTRTNKNVKDTNKKKKKK